MTNTTPNTIIYVCRTCRAEKSAPYDYTSHGAQLMRKVEAKLAEHPVEHVEVRSIGCLSQCDKSVAVAISAPEKFNYLISGMDYKRDADAIIEFATLYSNADRGIVKSADRPEAIRNGLVGRIPPLNFTDPASDAYKLPEGYQDEE